VGGVRDVRRRDRGGAARRLRGAVERDCLRHACASARRRDRRRREPSAPTSTACCLYAVRPCRVRAAAAYRRVSTRAGKRQSANGTPALITQGGSMSRPILERIGLRTGRRVAHAHGRVRRGET
jgi:hypothetical protein